VLIVVSGGQRIDELVDYANAPCKLAIASREHALATDLGAAARKAPTTHEVKP
jgi:hypothetical protein